MELDLSACLIEELPHEIGNLVHLKKLKAENNFLKDLPHSSPRLFPFISFDQQQRQKQTSIGKISRRKEGD